MSTMQTSPPDYYLPTTRLKAVDDARKVQASIDEKCRATGKDPPPYTLTELIGKGTFGRVYKATGASGKVVAVKIISIEEGDILDPSRADTFRDILKEVNTLKLLGTSGAQNVNVVIDAILLGQTMWMVTEYCAGGSVATLMRPTMGLPEKWIIPIAREVALAIYWVHKQGIIHRDIKCANVLITDEGQVQLCDFGVAGIIENKFDKRSTVTGTLQWMAPELFDSQVAYGTEVDIWAFGSMAYEMAKGLPPNATTAIDPSQFGSYLKQNVPRLDGDRYSSGLKDLVAFCMVDDPKQRPAIEMIQKHPYIVDTDEEYPTASLSKLVRAYNLWESKGGTRLSLFAAGGARGPLDEDLFLPPNYQNDEWNFGLGDDMDPQMTMDASEAEMVYDAYGSRVDLPAPAPQSISRRRRKPPPNLPAFKAPLEKVFDPNTISNYRENVQNFYQKQGQSTSSDLPLRDDTQQSKLRESLIDLDASLKRTVSKAPQLEEMETIRPGGRQAPPAPLKERSRSPGNRRTQDWTFPLMSPVSPGFDPSRFVSEDDNASIIGAYQGEPTPRKPPLVPIPESEAKRVSAVSLIDLDESLDTGPSTADSDLASVLSSDSIKTPFELERHSLFVPASTREPSIYVSFEGDTAKPMTFDTREDPPLAPQAQQRGDSSPQTSPRQRPPTPPPKEGKPLPPLKIPMMPPAPTPPSAMVMGGMGDKEELKDELYRMIASMNAHLKFTGSLLETMPVGKAGVYPRGNARS